MRQRIFKISVNWGIVIGSSSRALENSKLKDCDMGKIPSSSNCEVTMTAVEIGDLGFCLVFVIHVERES